MACLQRPIYYPIFPDKVDVSSQFLPSERACPAVLSDMPRFGTPAVCYRGYAPPPGVTLCNFGRDARGQSEADRRSERELRPQRDRVEIAPNRWVPVQPDPIDRLCATANGIGGAGGDAGHKIKVEVDRAETPRQLERAAGIRAGRRDVITVFAGQGSARLDIVAIEIVNRQTLPINRDVVILSPHKQALVTGGALDAIDRSVVDRVCRGAQGAGRIRVRNFPGFAAPPWTEEFYQWLGEILSTAVGGPAN